VSYFYVNSVQVLTILIPISQVILPTIEDLMLNGAYFFDLVTFVSLPASAIQIATVFVRVDGQVSCTVLITGETGQTFDVNSVWQPYTLVDSVLEPDPTQPLAIAVTCTLNTSAPLGIDPPTINFDNISYDACSENFQVPSITSCPGLFEDTIVNGGFEDGMSPWATEADTGNFTLSTMDPESGLFSL
jgi:hypothetical protein